MLYLEDSYIIVNAHDRITYVKSLISISGKSILKFEELLVIWYFIGCSRSSMNGNAEGQI